MIDQVELMRLILKNEFQFTFRVNENLIRVYRYKNDELMLELRGSNNLTMRSGYSVDEIKKAAIAGKLAHGCVSFNLIAIGEVDD